jgi:hypothetical protein
VLAVVDEHDACTRVNAIFRRHPIGPQRQRFAFAREVIVRGRQNRGNQFHARAPLGAHCVRTLRSRSTKGL